MLLWLTLYNLEFITHFINAKHTVTTAKQVRWETGYIIRKVSQSQKQRCSILKIPSTTFRKWKQWQARHLYFFIFFSGYLSASSFWWGFPRKMFHFLFVFCELSLIQDKKSFFYLFPCRRHHPTSPSRLEISSQITKSQRK